MPSIWRAFRVRPPETASTPLMLSICETVEAEKLSCDVARKESRENFVPGLPRLRKPN